MYEVVGVVFKENGRVYFFSPNGGEIQKNDNLIVETERGLQFGSAVTDIISMKKDNLNLPLKNVIRKATKEDEQINKKNISDAKKALNECEKLIQKYELKMRVIDSNFTFDRNQLVFQFSSDDRIDFRKLAKDLAAIYKTRIELRQIGVRDRAREIGGLGPCGRLLCCSLFLKNFDTVSINMAKTQNLSLNPNKINGSCGRLLCCLNYENETYEELKRDMPDVGNKIKAKNGDAKVISVDIFNRSYKILYENGETEEIKL